MKVIISTRHVLSEALLPLRKPFAPLREALSGLRERFARIALSFSMSSLESSPIPEAAKTRAVGNPVKAQKQ